MPRCRFINTNHLTMGDTKHQLSKFSPLLLHIRPIVASTVVKRMTVAFALDKKIVGLRDVESNNESVCHDFLVFRFIIIYKVNIFLLRLDKILDI